MGEGKLKNTGNIKCVRKVAPSRLHAFRECSLRELWNCCDGLEQLPRSPNAEVGTITHKILEEAGVGRFTVKDPKEIEQRWDFHVTAVEERIARSWLKRHLLPLRGSITNFEVKRRQAIARAQELSKNSQRWTRSNSSDDGHRKFGCELPVRSHDGFVRGKIDAVIPSANGPILRDYKSGAVYERGSEDRLRDEYISQMWLYAALYHRSVGIWPSELQLSPVIGDTIKVQFDRSNCDQLLDDSVAFVFEINTLIEDWKGEQDDLQEKLAHPSPENCRFCSHRPVCSPYRIARVQAKYPREWPNDVWGEISNVEVLGNGKVLIRFSSGKQVRALDNSNGRHPAIDQLSRGDRASVFNTRQTRSDHSFVQGLLTTIYKE